MWVRYSTIELPAPPRERWRFLACRSGAYPHLSLAPTTPAAEESVGADGDDLSGHLGCLTITGTFAARPTEVSDLVGDRSAPEPSPVQRHFFGVSGSDFGARSQGARAVRLVAALDRLTPHARRRSGQALADELLNAHDLGQMLSEAARSPRIVVWRAKRINELPSNPRGTVPRLVDLPGHGRRHRCLQLPDQTRCRLVKAFAQWSNLGLELAKSLGRPRIRELGERGVRCV